MDIALPAIFGVVGVILGVILGSAFELWKRALEGQAAARVIRIETIENRVAVAKALTSHARLMSTQNSAWRDHRLALVPFLTELQFGRIAQAYAGLSQIEEAEHSRSDDQLADWMNLARDNGRVLRRVEAANPWTLALDLIRKRRVATEEEIVREFGLAERSEQPQHEVK
jgi:hypothetical protein